MKLFFFFCSSIHIKTVGGWLRSPPERHRKSGKLKPNQLCWILNSPAEAIICWRWKQVSIWLRGANISPKNPIISVISIWAMKLVPAHPISHHFTFSSHGICFIGAITCLKFPRFSIWGEAQQLCKANKSIRRREGGDQHLYLHREAAMTRNDTWGVKKGVKN